MASHDLSFGPLAQEVAKIKYLGKRSWQQCVDDVVNSIVKFNSQTRNLFSPAEEKLLREAILYRWFLPGGRYIYYSDKKKRFYNNCFLFNNQGDTREGWAKTAHDAMSALMSGGGIGIDYGGIREKGSLLGQTGGVASGPLSLMQIVNDIGRQVQQGGSRRSAIYGSLPWDHPDIMQFIEAKNWSDDIVKMKERDYFFPATLDNTNISVRLDKKFWESLDSKNKNTELIYDKAIWNMLRTSEPGFQNDWDNQIFRNACIAKGELITCRIKNYIVSDSWNHETEFQFEWIEYELPIEEIINRFDDGNTIEALTMNELTKELEWKEILNAKLTQKNAKIIKLAWNAGHLKCTPDHKIFTFNYSWMEAQELKKYYPYPKINLLGKESNLLGYYDNNEFSDVYDLTVKDNHNFFANKLMVSNCTEIISADSHDVCNIGSINLARIDTKQEFADIVSVATKFLYAGSIASEVPLEQIEEVKKKNRRIGLGCMGFHEWLIKREFKYEFNSELQKWMEIYQSVTSNIGKECAKVTGENESIATRSIAPNGTIGIIAETTTGIEPVFATAYKRKYIVGDKDRKFQYVIDSTTKRLIKEGYIKNPNEVEDAITLSKDPEKRIKFQWNIQKYVDQGISSTINIPNFSQMELTQQLKEKENYKILLRRYLPELRGITFYSDGSRGGQPLEKVDYNTASIMEGVIVDETSSAACGSGLCGS